MIEVNTDREANTVTAIALRMEDVTGIEVPILTSFTLTATTEADPDTTPVMLRRTVLTLPTEADRAEEADIVRKRVSPL